MGFLDSIWGGIKGAATGFLGSGFNPIGAAIGGGLGVANSFGGGGNQPQPQLTQDQVRAIIGEDTYNSYMSESGFGRMGGLMKAQAQAERMVASGDYGGLSGAFSTTQGPTSDLVDANPDFQYWEPYTTQSDINASNALGSYEDVFRDAAGRYGGYQDRAFDIYENAMGQIGDAGSGLALDWGEIGDTANQMAYGQNYWLTHGTAGTEGSVQGDLQAALNLGASSGFGAGGGLIGNALTNTFDRIGRTNLESADRNLGTIGGIEAADLASQRNLLGTKLEAALSGMQNFTGAELSALESAYGSAASAAELPFGRSGERQNRQFQQEAQPYILDALKGTPWLEQQAQLLGTQGTMALGDYLFGGYNSEGERSPGAVGGIIDTIGGLLPWNWGGGGGGGSTDIADTYDYYDGTITRPGHEPIPTGTRTPNYNYLRYGGNF